MNYRNSEFFNYKYMIENYNEWDCNFNWFLRYTDKETLNKKGVKTIRGGSLNGCPIIPLFLNNNIHGFIIKNIVDNNRRKYLYNGFYPNQNQYIMADYKDYSEITVVEGFSAYYNFIKNKNNIMCLMGTRLSCLQKRFLNKFDKINLFFDDDRAGIIATERLKQTFSKIDKIGLLKSNDELF